MASRFLITGCGRSGTGYTAGLFAGLGLPCGHEVLFNPVRLARGTLYWPEDIPGESSWLAAPLLAHLPPGTPVLHQVREPLAVVRSLLRIRLFSEPSTYRRFAEELCPELAVGDALERCLRYWWLWNLRVEQEASRAGLPYRRYRLEDLDSKLLGELLAFIGAEPRTLEDLYLALERRPRDYNTRGNKALDEPLDWGDLPEGEALRGVKSLAERYGFSLEPADLRV